MTILKVKSLKLTNEKNIKYESDKITNPRAVFSIMQALHATEKPQEYLYMIGLDTCNNVSCIANISIGKINCADLDPRTVFQYLYLSNSVGFILAHNHPSGNLKPSDADITITKHINEMANLLRFNLLDHVIVTQNNYISLKEQQIF